MCQNEIEAAKDAVLEIELFDDDEKVPFKVGDSFIQLSLEDVKTELEKRAATLEQELGKCEAERESILEDMARAEASAIWEIWVMLINETLRFADD